MLTRTRPVKHVEATLPGIDAAKLQCWPRFEGAVISSTAPKMVSAGQPCCAT